mmetsp:Transcript_6282/g.10265  ORF Transcript_6282/g.10265 Transcript_6282/m.10265 type:complete len:201 (-) Transcript_6282:44-646(-)
MSKQDLSSRKGKKEAEKCGVCLIADSRYKCPKCRAPYCSVGCCKTHKETCSQLQLVKNTDNSNEHDNVSSTSEAARKTHSSSASAPFMEDDSTELSSDQFHIITAQQKKQLSGCREVRDMLKSKRLRDKIAEIDGAGGARRAALKRARTNPEFEQFLDIMLRAVEVKVDTADKEERGMGQGNNGGCADEEDQEKGNEGAA